MSALDVLHVDNHVLVVAKPAGLACVPDESGDDSLLDRAKRWVAREFAKPGAVFLGVVHRLDRPVSGCVAFGRTSKGASRLSASLRDGRFEKTYLAVADGGFAARPLDLAGEGLVEEWLVKDAGRGPIRVRRLAERPLGRDGEAAKLARTAWRVLERREVGGRVQVLLELDALTGRPHQLRVACAGLGLPLLGDVKYAPRGPGEAGHPGPLPDRSVALHAARLAFPHPTRNETVRCQAPPPTRHWWTGWAAIG